MISSDNNVSFFYECCRVLVSWFFGAFYNYSTKGHQHIPLTGGVIFATNHTSFYDPPVVGMFVRQRPLNYFARDTLFKGFAGKIIRRLNAIPVNRNAADIKSIKATLSALKQGGAIVIFPEGTRSVNGKLQEPKPGTGMIACKANATVVPTRIFGTFEAYGRHKKLPELQGSIHVHFGQPILPSDLDPGKDHPDRYLEASRRIMEKIAQLESPTQTIV